jgi:hypothetical protein
MATNPYIGAQNPYLQQTIDQAQGDLVRNFNLTAQPAYNAAMLRSGSFGNAGVQQMNENAQRNLQGSLGNISTQMRGADYANQQQLYMQQQGMDTAADQFNRSFDRSGSQWQQGFDRQGSQWQQQFDTNNDQWNLGFDRSVFNDSFGQQQQQLQTGIGLLGTLAGYNANDLSSANAQQNTPLNYWQQFSQGANSIGQGYGTTTGTTGTSSNPLVSAIGGAQLGSKAWGSWANSNNYGTSGNNYNGTSNNPSAPNYENQQDLGNPWGGWNK